MKKKKGFRLKLGPRPLTDKEIAERIAQKASTKAEYQRKLIKDWITIDSGFDKKRYIDVWENYRKEYGERFMDECLRIYAIANAALDVNTMLNVNMGMKDAGIDMSVFKNILDKIFTINLTNSLIEKVYLNDKVKEELLSRIIAREFPFKGNKKQQIINDILGVGTSERSSRVKEEK